MGTISYCFTFLILLLPCILSAQPIVDPNYGQAARTCETNAKTTLTLSDAIARLAHPNHPIPITCFERVVVEPGKTYQVFGGFIINGELEFLDAPGSTTTLETSFIIVQGKVKAGSIASPYKGQLNIIMRDATVDIKWPTRTTNSIYGNEINLGRKPFVTYGGDVELVGEFTGHVYARLVRTIEVGDTKLYTQHDMTSYWRAGDKLAIASGSIDNKGDSWVTIDSITYNTATRSTEVTLTGPVGKKHEVRFIKSDNPRGLRYHFLSPEVMKTNRNIKITGMPLDTDLDAWLDTNQAEPRGGHFMISHSGGKQVVGGVEFAGMGQAGILGRYPLHFHFGGNVAKGSTFANNSIHHSKQRCLVVHATNNLPVVSNAAFRTAGHCFMTEDGIEQNNFFLGNIGMATRTAIAKISPEMTDDRAATFWMASPKNHFIHNVAAGSHDGGFWFEPPVFAGGSAKKFKVPGWDTFKPINSDFGVFSHNTAHSAGVGLMTYPGGVFVPYQGKAHLDHTYTWSTFRGWLSIQGSNQKITNSNFVDVYMIGINTAGAIGHTVENIEIIGAQDNTKLCFGQASAIHFENHVNPIWWKNGINGWKVKNVHIQDWATTSKSCAVKQIGINLKKSKDLEWFPSSTSLQDFSFKNVDNQFEVEGTAANPEQIALQIRNIGFTGLQPSEIGYLVEERPTVPTDKMATAGCVPRMGVTLPTNFKFCPAGCVRMVTFAYQSIPGQEQTKVRFISPLGVPFVFTPANGVRHANGINIDRYLTKLFAPGKYIVQILNSANLPVPATMYSKDTVRVYITDAIEGVPACTGKVEFQLVGETAVLPSVEGKSV